jgi:hypothetical protein
MPLNFPTSPSTNDTYSLGNKTWTYNGYAWDLSSSTSNLYTTTIDFGATGITTEQSIQSFAIATYRSAKYTIQLSNSTNYALYEIAILHDGTTVTVFDTAYSQTYFDGDYVNIASKIITSGTINANLRFYTSAGNVIFAASAISGTVSVKGQVTLIKA